MNKQEASEESSRAATEENCRSLEKQIIQIKVELADCNCDGDEQILLAKQFQNEITELRKQLDETSSREKEAERMEEELAGKTSHLEKLLEELTSEVEHLRKETQKETKEKTMLLERLNSSRSISCQTTSMSQLPPAGSPSSSFDADD